MTQQDKITKDGSVEPDGIGRKIAGRLAGWHRGLSEERGFRPGTASLRKCLNEPGDERSHKYVNKLCFTSCLDRNFIPGAIGLIRSIRKFYSKDEADIVLFLDQPAGTFSRFCREQGVDLQYFGDINTWVQPLVYDEPEYANETRHFYHPEFRPSPDLHSEPQSEAGFGWIRHLHPLNVKAYCTGYCLCVKKCRRVVHIDCDAFLLSRIDEMFERHPDPGTIIAFDDGDDSLENLTTLYGVYKPADFSGSDYGFNAGLVFYVNNAEVEHLARDFMFFIDSSYHYTHSGHFADQGILRALVAKYHLSGKVRFFRESAENWNPTSFRANDLEIDPHTGEWINLANGAKQYVWHSAGGEKLWTGRYSSQSVNEAWRWIDGPTADNWVDALQALNQPDTPYYDEVLQNNDFIDKLCFVTCLNSGYKLGGKGLIKSIRKFYKPEEADIVVFIDRDFDDFSCFCAEHSAEVRYFHEIDDWVQPLVYADPLYANDSLHYYHPGFEPVAEFPFGLDRMTGFGFVRHLHPLNVKAYCTGYCLCVRNYKRVVHIDSDAFLLARVDDIYDWHSEPDTVVGFEDDYDELPRLEPLFKVKKPDDFTGSQYGFNAGIVFYVNGRGVKELMRDFMFFVESCYHYTYAGTYHDADQGLLRCLVAKHAILGNIRFYREDNVNWNPTWKRAQNLSFDPDTQSWINHWNERKQFIWHDPTGGGTRHRVWTGRFGSQSVNEAWQWAGGSYENWTSVRGPLTEAQCKAIVDDIATLTVTLGSEPIRILNLGAGSCRSALGIGSMLRERGISAHIQASDVYSGGAYGEAFDHIRRLGMEETVKIYDAGKNGSPLGRFRNNLFDVIYVEPHNGYAEALGFILIASRLAQDGGIVIGNTLKRPDAGDPLLDGYGLRPTNAGADIWRIEASQLKCAVQVPFGFGEDQRCSDYDIIIAHAPTATSVQ